MLLHLFYNMLTVRLNKKQAVLIYIAVDNKMSFKEIFCILISLFKMSNYLSSDWMIFVQFVLLFLRVCWHVTKRYSNYYFVYNIKLLS